MMEVITISEASRMLGVTKARVYQLVSDGKLRAKEWKGRKVVSLEDVHKVIKDRKKGRPKKEEEKIEPIIPPDLPGDQKIIVLIEIQTAAKLLESASTILNNIMQKISDGYDTLVKQSLEEDNTTNGKKE